VLEPAADIDGELLRIREEVELFDFNISAVGLLLPRTARYVRSISASQELSVKRKERSTRNARTASALLSMRPGRTIQWCYDIFFRLGARDAAVVSQDDDALVA
jgi:hypothetical protein